MLLKRKKLVSFLLIVTPLYRSLDFLPWLVSSAGGVAWLQ